MAVSTVAFRYAKSLIDLAQDKNLTEEIHNDMVFFSETLTQNRPLSLMLKSPIVRHEKKAAVLKAIFEKRVNPVTMAFLNIIARKNREGIIDAIAEEYIRLYNESKGIEEATVITTTPLTEVLRQQIRAIVTNITGSKQISLQEKIDSKLIGGYVLRIGDRQIDASIRNQLNELRHEMLS